MMACLRSADFQRLRKSSRLAKRFFSAFLVKSRRRFGNESPLLIQIFHTLSDDGGPYPIDIDFARRFFVSIDIDVGRLINDYFVLSRLGRNGLAVLIDRRHVVGRDDGVILAGLINLHRLAIEFGIGEVVGRTPKINQREIELLRVLMDARAAPDDLLKLRHGANSTVEHDQAAGLCVNASGKQPRGRNENGIFCFWVDEVPELRLPLCVAPGDSHDIAVIFVAQIFVFIDQSLPHPRSMFLIHTKHDGFLETVVAFLQEIGNLLGNELGAVVNNERAVKILGVVKAVLDLIAVAVYVAPLRPVALDIHIDMDLDHFVRSQEAVLDTLPQRVGVNRAPEIMDIGDVLGFLGRGRESDLGGAGEVIENLPPGCIVGGAAAMTLINDDQVKKARREFPEELLALLRPRDGLIKPQVNFIGRVDAALFIKRRGEFDFGAVLRAR